MLTSAARKSQDIAPRNASRWSTEINRPTIGEALSHNFDGKVLNPYGIEIDLPSRAFKRLKKLHLLQRDREGSLRRIGARIFRLMPLWEGPDSRADRTTARVRRTAAIRAPSSRRSTAIARAWLRPQLIASRISGPDSSISASRMNTAA